MCILFGVTISTNGTGQCNVQVLIMVAGSGGGKSPLF